MVSHRLLFAILKKVKERKEKWKEMKVKDTKEKK